MAGIAELRGNSHAEIIAKVVIVRKRVMARVEGIKRHEHPAYRRSRC
jgi:hypothetical protein